MPQMHLGAPHGAGGAVGLVGPRASAVPALGACLGRGGAVGLWLPSHQNLFSSVRTMLQMTTQSLRRCLRSSWSGC